MKLAALIGAGLLATGTFAAMPADAQRWRDHRGYDRGYERGYHHRGPDRWHRGGYGWQRGPRWHGRGRGRLVCDYRYRGRQCYRVYR